MRKAAERNLGELNITKLTDEDKTLIRKYADSLNPGNSNSLVLYGADLQKNLAQLAHMLLGSMEHTDVDSTGELLQNTVTYLETIEGEEEKSVLFWQKKAKGLRLMNQYDQALANVEKIESSLKELQVKLLMDNTMLDQLCKMNEDYYHQILLRVRAARLRLGELKEDKSVDQYFLQRIEHRIEDLELTKSVASQQAAQFHVLKSNSASMIEGLQSVLYHVIPLWKGAISSARTAKQTQTAEQTQRSINNKMLRESLGEITRMRMEVQEKKIAAEREFSKMEDFC